MCASMIDAHVRGRKKSKEEQVALAVAEGFVSDGFIEGGGASLPPPLPCCRHRERERGGVASLKFE